MTIAGSDSGGCAGIQADLKTFSALGVFGTSVITSVTAQNTLGVYNVFNLPLNIISEQLDAVIEDIGADAVKTGMLATSEIIFTVSKKIKEYNIKNFIVDPVMVSTSGHILLEESALKTLKEELLPLAYVITPNMKEAEVLCERKVKTLRDMKNASKKIHEMGADNVVVKGGHLIDEAVDVHYDGHNFNYLLVKRIDTKNTHGTGCTFASAVTAYIAKGYNVKNSIMRAKIYLNGALRNSISIGKGAGPVNHFWRGFD